MNSAPPDSRPVLTVRRAGERGHSDHGWLKTWFSFSFADYYDPANMGFRALRVINDDHVAPGGGFPTHPHRDMEIFSYVLAGQLAHEDSLGNRRVLTPGQVQLMSAGSGITHSEFNPSSTEAVHLLQIWILPAKRGLAPRYTEWSPRSEADAARKVLLISPDGRDGSAMIAQDAAVWRLKLQPGESVTHFLSTGRGFYLHLIHGEARVQDLGIFPGDAVSCESPGDFTIAAGDQAVEALLFDLG